MNRHFVFALLLTVLLLLTGLVMVPATQGMPHAERNLMYGLVRVPVILVAVWLHYGRHMPSQRVIGFALLLTLVMMGTGVMSIPAVSGVEPIWQNAAYTVGRVPFIYIMALLVFGGRGRPPGWAAKWKTQ